MRFARPLALVPRLRPSGLPPEHHDEDIAAACSDGQDAVDGTTRVKQCISTSLLHNMPRTKLLDGKLRRELRALEQIGSIERPVTVAARSVLPCPSLAAVATAPVAEGVKLATIVGLGAREGHVDCEARAVPMRSKQRAPLRRVGSAR